MNKSKIIFGIFASLLSASAFAQSDSTSSIEVVDHSTSANERAQILNQSTVMSHVVFDDSESGVTVYAVPEPELIKIVK